MSESIATGSLPDIDAAAIKQPGVFEVFPNFPLELRLLVWEAVCSEPRLFDIWYSEDGLEYWGDAFSGSDWPHLYYTHGKKLPSILHTCREARNVGLQHYQLEFGTEMDGIVAIEGARRSRIAQVGFNLPAEIYVNWQCDITCPSLSPGSNFRATMPHAEDSLLMEFTLRYSYLQRFAVQSNRIKPFNLATFASDFDWLLNLLSRTRGTSPQPLEEITVYCYLPLQATAPLEADEVSLNLVRFSGTDEDIPQQLRNTTQLDRLRKARDNISEAIKHVGVLRAAPKKRDFKPPRVFIAFLDVVDVKS
ncbi:hypothetical protein BKA65DRAFT_581175 [Rhexocercosporidium sp. MPI-PUGE-AT-0058]|nr:hypothetical protein BKA65DRAFT_581175 [Rhexocercosporidium sp. MPI-PUGE-AT-0058]